MASGRDKILSLCVLEVGVHFFEEMLVLFIGRIPRVCRRSVGSIENYKVLLGTRKSSINKGSGMGTLHKGVGQKENNRAGFLTLEGMDGAELESVHMRVVNHEESLLVAVVISSVLFNLFLRFSRFGVPDKRRVLPPHCYKLCMRLLCC